MSARHDLAALVPEGEAVVLRIKPSVLSIAARHLWWHAVVFAALGGAIAGVADPWRGRAALALAATFALVVVWDALVWASRAYVLTDRRIAAMGGVLRRWGVSVPLDRVQHVVLSRTIAERLTGLGSLGVATAGTGEIELAWVMIDRPRGTLARVRERVDAARARAGHASGAGA